MSTESKESALSRWSRRKHEVDLLEQAEEVVEIDAAGADEIANLESESDVQPVLTDADMPDIETLNEDSDFSGFMSEGVSDELRNLALRKLFRAPVFNIRDGLDEYDEDYTYFEKLGDIVTCDMKHHIEMKEKKLREAEALEAQALEVEEDLVEDVEAIEDIDDEIKSPSDESPVDETPVDETPVDETPETVAETEPGSKPKQESYE
jgi:hypothetical protein